MEEKIKKIHDEYKRLQEKIKKAESASDWKELGKLQKELEFFEKIFAKEEEIKEIKKNLKELDQLLVQEKDEQLRQLAKEEKEKMDAKLLELTKELEKLITRNNQEKDFDSIIVEIRAGAGGEEAALFASDLFNMYSKYAASNGWKVKILDSHRTDLGGLKQIIFEISGKNVYSKMKYEGGVHRVQRIPETEKSGRIHTSTASVAILPKPKKEEIEIKPEDLRIETFRASGPGGQYVNRRETAVRITHIPTGIVVSSQNERSQAANRETALSILEAKLLELKLQKENEKIQEKRSAQIGRMERAEKIRTYNFPQSRITDHRIKKSWHNLEEILAGDLDPIIKELEKALNG